MATPKTTPKPRTRKASTPKTESVIKESIDTVQAISEEAFEKSDKAFQEMGFALPDTVRAASERSIAQAKEGYTRLKSLAEDTTDLMEETVESARDGVLDLQVGTLDAAKAHSDAVFGLMKDLMVTQSVGDAVQIHAAFARERFEAFVDYSKDVQSRVGAMAEQTAKPAKTAFEKALNTSS